MITQFAFMTLRFSLLTYSLARQEAFLQCVHPNLALHAGLQAAADGGRRPDGATAGRGGQGQGQI